MAAPAISIKIAGFALYIQNSILEDKVRHYFRIYFLF